MAITTCYRHQDRATGASCTRCGKPICADCMVQAPVGHHCPDCVREANKGVRRVNVDWRRPATAGAVTKVLIAVNVVVYLLQQSDRSIESRFAMWPFGVANGQWYRMLTGTFLHASILHIVFNMAALYIFGVQVEAALGKSRYLALYLLSALGGSLCSLLLAAPGQPSVGASGAIFGLFGAFFVIARARGADSGPIVGLIVVNLLLSFADPIIDWRGHVGGLVTGTAIAFGYQWADRLPPSMRKAAQVAVVVVAGAIIAGLSIARAGTLAA